jgi:dynein heavy chain 1
VREMNGRIKTTLLTRLRQAIETWIETFENARSEGVNDDSRRKRLSGPGGIDFSQLPSMKRLGTRNINAQPSHLP